MSVLSTRIYVRPFWLWFLVVTASPALCQAAGPVWKMTFDGGAPDQGMSVKTDSASNIFTAVMTYLSPVATLWVTKWNSEGIEQWRRAIPVGTAGAPAAGSCLMTVSGDGAFVVCEEDAADHAAFAARVNSDGTVAWRTNLPYLSRPQVLVSDEAGNVFAAGKGSAIGELIVARLTLEGPAWSLGITNALAPARGIIATHVAIAGEELLVTGTQEREGVDFGTQHLLGSFAARVRPDGELLWLRSFTSTNRMNLRSRSIIQTGDGAILFGGALSMNSTQGYTMVLDNILVRLNEDGEEQFRTNLPGTGPIEFLSRAGESNLLATGAWVCPGELTISHAASDGTVHWTRNRRLNCAAWIDVTETRWVDENRFVVGGYDFRPFADVWPFRRSYLRSLFLFEVNVVTGKARKRTLALPSQRVVSRAPGERRDFALDAGGNLLFMTGDGTSWPNVVLLKYPALKPPRSP